MLQQSVAYTRAFFLTLSSDHISPSTGKTPTVNISKGGAAFAAAAGVVSEIGSGWYKVALTTADTGTQGDLAYHITATASDPTDFVDRVVPGPVHPAGVSIASGGITAASFAANAIASAGIATDAIGSAQLSTAAAQKVADNTLDRANAIETGLTLRQALRLVASVLAGKLSGAGTTTVLIRNAVADSKDRITATVDASGNRSAVVTDVT